MALLLAYSVNCGGPTPRFRFSQRTTWAMRNDTVGYDWRHIGPLRRNGGTFLPALKTIKAYDCFDLNFACDATKNVRLTLSINNATDKQPPVVGNTIATTTANSGNTFPQWYDGSDATTHSARACLDGRAAAASIPVHIHPGSAALRRQSPIRNATLRYGNCVARPTREDRATGSCRRRLRASLPIRLRAL